MKHRFHISSSHSKHKLVIQLVFVTYNRMRVFKEQDFPALENIFKSICHQERCVLISFGGEDNHIHLLVQYRPSVSISKLANLLKGKSSYLYWRGYPGIGPEPGQIGAPAREASNTDPDHKKIRHLWSKGYYANTVSNQTVQKSAAYIKRHYGIGAGARTPQSQKPVTPIPAGANAWHTKIE